jgi:sulfur carrier protein ThiS
MSRRHDAARTEARTIGVSVILSAGLRRLRPAGAGGPQHHTLAAGATLGDLLAKIGIDPAIDLTAAVDGELAERDTPLRDGAEVMLLVPMEGGAAAEGEATIRNAVKVVAVERARSESPRNAVKVVAVERDRSESPRSEPSRSESPSNAVQGVAVDRSRTQP